MIRSGTEGPYLTWSHVKLQVLHWRPPRPYLSAPGQLQDLGGCLTSPEQSPWLTSPLLWLHTHPPG